MNNEFCSPLHEKMSLNFVILPHAFDYPHNLISQAVVVKGKEEPIDLELFDEAIAVAVEQTVGPNLVTLVLLVTEKLATGTSRDG